MSRLGWNVPISRPLRWSVFSYVERHRGASDSWRTHGIAALGFAVDPLKRPFHLFVISFPSFGRQEPHERTTILQRCPYIFYAGFTQQHQARHFTFDLVGDGVAAASKSTWKVWCFCSCWHHRLLAWLACGKWALALKPREKEMNCLGSNGHHCSLLC